jgi:hypothetical protein
METSLKDKMHGIFFLIFTVINLTVFVYLKYYINDKNECDCANDKVLGLIQPIDYIVFFSLAGFIIGLINLFINFNRGCSSLPIIGTFFNVGVAVLCLLQIYMIVIFLSRISKQKCVEIKKCQNKPLKIASKFITQIGLYVYIIAFVIAIMLVWI